MGPGSPARHLSHSYLAGESGSFALGLFLFV